MLKTALRKGLSGEGLSKEEAGEFVKLPDSSVFEILPVTEKVRREKKGDEVNLCSIVNAKSGLCKEDCSFCSQSARYSTGVTEYPMAGPVEIVRRAEEAQKAGAREFSIVASGTPFATIRDSMNTIGCMIERILLSLIAELSLYLPPS